MEEGDAESFELDVELDDEALSEPPLSDELADPLEPALLEFDRLSFL